MRTTYTVRFLRPIIVADHWQIPFMNGTCRLVEEDGKAVALEIVFAGEPVKYSPLVEDLDGPIKFSITGRDDRLIFVKRHLEEATAFLECYHNIELATDDIAVAYAGETPEEEALIDIKSFTMGRHEVTLPLSFDMITRALMAAETIDGPKFEATLTKNARNALSAQQFIDSFRYSFLLIESHYGEGQFKKAGLIAALSKNAAFADIVRFAVRDAIPAKPGHQSDTATLLSTKPTTEAVIAHLVEKRGYYFHGNVKRKDAWKADDQRQAEALALLAIGIAQLIAQQAAAPMFADELNKRHFDDAMKAGAEIVFEVKFKFREPDEPFVRNGQINIRTTGTKVTGRQANSIAQQFLRQFEYDAPVASLETAECSVRGSGQKVFEMKFLVSGD